MSPVSRGENKTNRFSAGSSQDGEPVFLVIGRLGRPHGLHGDLQFIMLTDFPERLNNGTEIFVGKQKNQKQIESLRPHGNKFLLRIKGVGDRDQAELLRNTEVFVRTADIPDLPEGEFYQHQVLGLAVVTAAGEALGLIAEVLSTGANDVFVVRGEGKKEILIPRTDEVVLKIDLEAGSMIVSLPDGLAD